MKKLLLFLALIASASLFAQPAGSHVRWVKSAGVGDTKSYFQGNDQLYSTNSGGSFALIPKSTFLTPAQGNAAYSLLGHTHAAGDITSGTIATARLGSGTANNTTFLRGDQTWQTISAGSGDVVGPASSGADNIALFDGLTGKLIKDSGISLGEIVEEDPGPGVGMIESGAGVSPIILKNLKNGLGTEVVNNTGSVQVDIDFTAADRYYYSDGSALPVEGTVTSFARSILDDPDAATVRSTIGAQSAITFGTGVQTALGVNIGSAGAPVLFNGAGGTPSSLVGTNITGTAAGLTAGTVTTNANLTGPITSVGNATTIADGELAAIAGLTSAADKGIQFTGAGTAATYDLTAAGKALLDDASIAAQRTTLGYVPATVVKMSSTARVNNTLTADPELVVALAANERISGTITLFIAASAAGDFKYRITGPAGPTSVFMAQAWFASAGTTVTNLLSQAYNSSDQTATNASDFLLRVLINFSVENGATPGNFAVEWAQNTTAAGNATSMLVGSQIQYTTF